MKLLFLACLSKNTGNCTTAERIREHIESVGHTCVLQDTADLKSSEKVAHLIAEEPFFQAALAIHLYKGGRFLLDCQAPFGVVFGGTDINEDVKDETKRAVMGKVLKKARFAVAFTEKLKEEAETYWPSQGIKICVQPQGIETKATENFNWDGFLRSTGVNCENVEDLHVFLLVCGLRRVKDPLYLVDVFSEWHQEDPSVILIIIGPEIDPLFTEEVEVNVKRAKGVFLAAERRQQDLHAAMRRSVAVVNSSVSEGMSAAILEAMDLEVPVVARNIPGNAAVIKHEETGLLFSNPQEFVDLSRKLLAEPSLRERLVSKAKKYVKDHHCKAKEKDTYRRLIEQLH
ncbi:glycosyltransferase 1 domain-containing protein 1 isoform X4 [Lepisosteus oculatus]|uniref:glycosyltransferase 1 domain-containing protein 1 isoform X4 n=1 Tax=Lepisosteus oculatus TaxID=7918 RepID=UPI0035F5103A